MPKLDDSDSIDDEIPHSEPKVQDDVTAKEEVNGDEEEEDDDDSEDGDDEVYEVEDIMDHRFTKGKLLYHIHWKGYDEAGDYTWEPTENILPGARGKLAEYHDKIGGVPKAPLKKSKSTQSLRRQPSTDSPAPKRRKTQDDDEGWEPKKQDWEPEIDHIENIERDSNNQLLAYIKFKNGRKLKVSMDKVYRHCPRPMLRFYESHLQFNLE